MKFLKTVFKDILYVSKVTGTQKKKILIGISVIFSQLSVITDVFLIGLFAFLIAGQKTNIEIVDASQLNLNQDNLKKAEEQIKNI